MANLFYIILITLFLVQIPASLSEPDGYRIRSKRSIGDFIRRIFGRRKTGFQGTAQAQQLYNTQGSSYYPSYAYPNLYRYPMTLDASSSGQYPTYAGYPYSSYGSYAQASGAYPTYSAVAPAGSGTSAYGSGNSGTGSGLDFYSVLDHLVRSAGISPTGDQDTSASTISNIQNKGDTPVFSFKKLYSFPFYFNADNNVGESGYNLQIPFMKRHIRRMAQDYVKRRQWRQNEKGVNAEQLANFYVAQQLAQQNQLAQYVEAARREPAVSDVPEASESSARPAYYLEKPSEKQSSPPQPPSTSTNSVGQEGQVEGQNFPQSGHSVSVKTSYSAA